MLHRRQNETSPNPNALFALKANPAHNKHLAPHSRPATPVVAHRAFANTAAIRPRGNASRPAPRIQCARRQNRSAGNRENHMKRFAMRLAHANLEPTRRRSRIRSLSHFKSRMARALKTLRRHLAPFALSPGSAAMRTEACQTKRARAGNANDACAAARCVFRSAFARCARACCARPFRARMRYATRPRAHTFGSAAR